MLRVVGGGGPCGKAARVRNRRARPRRGRCAALSRPDGVSNEFDWINLSGGDALARQRAPGGGRRAAGCGPSAPEGAAAGQLPQLLK
ncbi:hypothetical protein EVAR_91508_1 [Eumeta japonica]|uniref:Uncharacterized protein n=1 Tax=Eumeta variegata TaxID=151549 RepID=A0A4C1VCG2_EUMVA|nr:hypothetical protein EVAR_91508_1 [Eumeta japonica]